MSEYDPNVIYVGGGEVTVRGNVSYGYGMWKSTDAGKTWKHIGLENSRHMPRIRIHPRNPDLVYAAVIGDLYKSSEERGVYRSVDGGETWEKIKQLTRNSIYNHSYVRKPVNAHPDFYALWADGHGRKPSESNIYFCDKEGAVYMLPRIMDNEFEKPPRYN